MSTHRPLRALPVLIACMLSISALLATSAMAKEARTHKSACTASAKASRHAKRGSGAHCSKSSHKKPIHKHAAKHKKASSSVVFMTPATCEDGSRPVREGDGYACEDGSEPACEDGSAPVSLTAGSAPMCRLQPGEEPEPGASGSECEGEEECATVEWSCEEEGGQSINCQQGGEEGDEEDS